MKWPELISLDHVLVGLNIKHPAFGILYVDRIQRTKVEMEELYKNNQPEIGQRISELYDILEVLDHPRKKEQLPFKYNSDFHTIVAIEHFPSTRINDNTCTQEHYLVYLDWTGY